MTNLKNNNSLISFTDMGFNNILDAYRKENNLNDFDMARVTKEHRERYTVKTEQGDLEAEIIGNLRYSANSRLDFPAVGDWVAISQYDDHKAFIHAVYERTTLLLRKAVGKDGEPQVIAANIDVAFIVQSVHRDFSLNRLERYLTICYDAKITPVIIINKIDLISSSELDELLQQINERIPTVKVIAVSAMDDEQMDSLKSFITAGTTYCMLGSSGVGKSTLINQLTGISNLETNTIGKSTDRGKHTTTHRELIVLPEGGIFIDTPGMRELGVTDVSDGMEQAFETILLLAEQCKFSDCSHRLEIGCAVKEALNKGDISAEYYENYLKINKEKAHYESSSLDKKRKGKDLAKIIKTVKKLKNN